MSFIISISDFCIAMFFQTIFLERRVAIKTIKEQKCFSDFSALQFPCYVSNCWSMILKYRNQMFTMLSFKLKTV